MDYCNGSSCGGVKKIILFKSSDVKYVDGQLTMKRKYGKFKREVIELTPDELKEINDNRIIVNEHRPPSNTGAGYCE